MTSYTDLPDQSSFSFASAALSLARETDVDGTYASWRKLLKSCDLLRGRRDPLADQNANLDMLLRAFEHTVGERFRNGETLTNDTAGLQLHIHLSRLWVLGAYEFLRTLHQAIKSDHTHPMAACMYPTNSKGCGKAHCVVCSIGHLKNEVAVVRMGLAKGEDAKAVSNPPLTQTMKDVLLAEPPVEEPPVSEYLISREAMQDGIMCWVRHDNRVGRDRLISRRSLSNQILLFAHA